MSLVPSRRSVGITSVIAAALSLLYSFAGTLIPTAFYGTQETPNMTLNLSKLGKNMVKKVPNMELVSLESLWADQTVVITFLRRFGCIFCRQGAQSLSSITPLLESHGVKTIAVGLEEFGLEDFVKGEYFKGGDLYIDVEKQSYKDIGYKRYSTIGVIMSLFAKKSRDKIAESRRDNLPGDLKGDGVQTGGTLVISKGGEKVLLDYRQDHVADQVDLSDILRVLNIPKPEGGIGNGAQGETVCNKE